MKTFTKIKDFVYNPYFRRQRKEFIENLDIKSIDSPLVSIINGFLKLPCCFTLQSCYGHFLFEGQKDPHSLKPIPKTENIKKVDYRIAYIAVCIENSRRGKKLYEELSMIPRIDKQYIQFGCAEWFWKQFLNSFVLQIEPKKYMLRDRADISFKEAQHIEDLKPAFFNKINKIVCSGAI